MKITSQRFKDLSFDPNLWWRITSRMSSMENKEENLSPLSVACTRNIDSKFTPIGRVDSRTWWFWPLHSPSRRLKKSKVEEVDNWKSRSLETQTESATRVESRGLLTWACPLGTHGLVYQVWPIMGVDRHKDSTRLTWKRRKAIPICIRLELNSGDPLGHAHVSRPRVVDLGRNSWPHFLWLQTTPWQWEELNPKTFRVPFTAFGP
jgi:hypothetical protein